MKKNQEDGKIININRREIRKRKRRAARIRFICLLAAVSVIAFLMTPVFNIKWIDVTGNEKTTFGQIVKSSGITYEQNIFRLNIKKSKEAVKKLPYVDTVKIARHLPGGVMFKITERVPVACVKFGTGYAFLDKEGRLLELSDSHPGIPEIQGITLKSQKIGDILKDTMPDEITAMDELLSTLTEHGLIDRTSVINIKNPENVTFVFDGNKTVKTGGNYRLDYKLMMLEATISELAKSEEGIIDLSIEGQALFSPTEE